MDSIIISIDNAADYSAIDTAEFESGRAAAAGAVDADNSGGYIDPVYRAPRPRRAAGVDPLMAAALDWLKGGYYER